MIEGSYSITALAWIASAPLIGGFLFGYDIGAISYILVQWTTADDAGNGADGGHTNLVWAQWIAESPLPQGALVSASSTGAFLGSVLFFVLADSIGRRRELQWGASCYLFGSILQIMPILPAFAHTRLWGTFILLSGRLVLGLGIGFAMHGGPTYLGEMSPPSIRGMLVTVLEASIVFGLLCGYVIGDLSTQSIQGSSNIASAWIWILLLVIVLASIMYTISICIIPESTRWLLMVTPDNDEEALASVQFLYPSSEIAQRELAAIKDSLIVVATEVDDNAEFTSISFATVLGKLRRLLQPRNRYAIISGAGLAVLQQLTGQPSVLSFVAPILHTVGLSSHYSIGIGVLKLVSTLAVAPLVEKNGRRTLLFIGTSLMLFALTFLVVSLSELDSISEQNDEHAHVLAYCSLAFRLIYIVGYQIGIGPITMIVNSEVFPSHVRATGIAVSAQLSFLSHALVQFAFPSVVSSLGLKMAFGIFAAFSAAGLWFTYNFIPEMKGLTLEEIEAAFALRGSERVQHPSPPEAQVETCPLVLDQEVA